MRRCEPLLWCPMNHGNQSGTISCLKPGDRRTWSICVVPRPEGSSTSLSSVYIGNFKLAITEFRFAPWLALKLMAAYG